MLVYEERLAPTPIYWVLPLLAATFGAAALAPVDTLLAAAAGVVAGGAATVALARTSTRIAVLDEELHVGVAHVPLALVSGVDVLDPARARLALGPELDARAFVCTRPWVRDAVRIHLDDPADPTPYWLVATRNPAALTEAVTSRGPSDGGQAAHSEQTS